MRRSTHGAARGAAVVAAAALGCRLTWTLTRGPAQRLVEELGEHGPSALVRLPLDQSLTGICSLALLTCAGWLLVATAAVVGQAVTGSSGRLPRLCPAILRRAVLTACGVALSSSVAQPAVADPPGASDPVSGVVQTRLGGLALPDRAVGPPPAARACVVVAPGDSLWAIARTALGAGARDVEVAAATRRLHEANVERVGPDPDLILPGTRLRLPDLRTDRKEPR